MEIYQYNYMVGIGGNFGRRRTIEHNLARLSRRLIASQKYGERYFL